MCEPISATTMMYISIASAAVSAYATHESAKAQRDQIKTQMANEREEVHEKAEEELGQRIRDSRERRARARVAAGESGALGNSFAASINQSLTDQNMDAALVQKNAAFADRGVQDRANVALSQIRDPSALEAGLQIATAGINGYRTGLGIEGLRDAAPSVVDNAQRAQSVAEAAVGAGPGSSSAFGDLPVPGSNA
jgi:hypothetical protein